MFIVVFIVNIFVINKEKMIFYGVVLMLNTNNYFKL